ncbi:MAG: hypothetical protein RML35_07395 [Chloroherpetonaceae bacterium]|nr:hypothetical protein [Chloroherpetonaceae bacterium]
MVFKYWVEKLLQKKQDTVQLDISDIEIVPEAVDPVEVEAAGLNFHTAIISHQNWKTRFKAMIESGIAEALTP